MVRTLSSPSVTLVTMMIPCIAGIVGNCIVIVATIVAVTVTVVVVVSFIPLVIISAWLSLHVVNELC